MPQQNSITSSPRVDLAHRVGEHLAVLGGEQAREVLAVGVEELADPEEELGAARERERAPRGERRLRRLDGERRSPPARRSRPRRSGRRSPGRRRARLAPIRPRGACPPIQWLIVFDGLRRLDQFRHRLLLESSGQRIAWIASGRGRDRCPTSRRSGRGGRRGGGGGLRPSTEEQIALAEEPGLWLPDEPTRMVFHGDGFAFVLHGRSAWVHRLRLPRRRRRGAAGREPRRRDPLDRELDGGDVVARRAHDAPATSPSACSSSGSSRDDPPEMTSLTIARRPRGEPAVEVRSAPRRSRRCSQALEIDWEAFGVAEDERELRRREARRGLADARGRRHARRSYLAYLDGEPVGFGRDVFTPHGALMLGGATLPDARGQGVYTSLVLARWERGGRARRAAARRQRRPGVGADPRAARLRADRAGCACSGRRSPEPR